MDIESKVGTNSLALNANLKKDKKQTRWKIAKNMKKTS